MTTRLNASVAATRANELARASKHAFLLAGEPAEKPSGHRRGWFARLRAARLWQQECAEHQL